MQYAGELYIFRIEYIIKWLCALPMNGNIFHYRIEEMHFNFCLHQTIFNRGEWSKLAAKKILHINENVFDGNDYFSVANGNGN